MRERRKHDRIELVAEVEIPHDDELEILFAHDLSEGGVFLAARPDESPWLLPGVPVDVAIALPGSEDPGLVIRTRGRVVWRQDASSGNPPGIGVAFDVLDAETLSVIRRVLGRIRAATHDA